MVKGHYQFLLEELETKPTFYPLYLIMYKYVQKTRNSFLKDIGWEGGKEEGREPECSKGREGGEKEGRGRTGGKEEERTSLGTSYHAY